MPLITRSYRWYALYTTCNHEVAARNYLTRNNIEVFLPTQKVLRQWQDRKKWIDVPLFPSYLFVRVSCREFEKAVQSRSICSFVKIAGSPCPIPDEQIKAIQVILENKVPIQVSNEKFTPGDPVIIKEGPLAGYSAEVVECRGKKKLVLRVEGANQVIVITGGGDYVIPSN